MAGQAGEQFLLVPDSADCETVPAEAWRRPFPASKSV